MAQDSVAYGWTEGPSRRQLLCAAAALLVGNRPAYGLEEPLLNISLASKEIVLDRADLEALPQRSFTTSTIWTSGQQTFSGPPLRSVLTASGIVTGTVELVAANDYRVSIAVDDLGAEVPILATRMNGGPFPLREKGPLWLVYPYDSDPAFRSEVIYARSIWQIVRIKSISG